MRHAVSLPQRGKVAIARRHPYREPPKLAFARFGEPLIAQRRQTHSISLRFTQGDGDAKSNPKGDATCGIGISASQFNYTSFRSE
jgi:hypothetical protein